MSRGSVTLTIIPDVSRFTAAVEAARRAFGRFGAAMVEAAKAFAKFSRVQRPLDIAQFGPRNLAGDGSWQSDLCAAWVHSACPSAFCDCTCHGGTVR